jgi:hypothetical protein
LPTQHGRRPAVQVSVALSTLLGLDEQPGDLAGYGPIPASIARHLAADPTGTWRRLLTDEHGRLLDYGRTTYRPPTDLSDFVIARDRTCQFPNCNRPAGSCELDHRRAWTQGGTTSADNIDALCSRHHHTKHDAAWRTHREPDGATTWTSPTGHHYRKPPDTYPIDHTRQPSRETDQNPEIDTVDPPPF